MRNLDSGDAAIRHLLSGVIADRGNQKRGVTARLVKEQSRAARREKWHHYRRIPVQNGKGLIRQRRGSLTVYHGFISL